MAVAVKTAVVRLDHIAVPTNDLGTSLAFYTDALGAQLTCGELQPARAEPRRAGYGVRDRGNHHGMGIALQDDLIPAPIRKLEGPVCGFEIDERGIDGVVQVLREKNVAFEARWSTRRRARSGVGVRAGPAEEHI